MAQRTVQLDIVKSGYIRELYPTDVFPTDADSEYQISRNQASSASSAYRNCLCFGFLQIPDALKYYELDDITLPLYFDGNGTCFGVCIDDFDPQTLTYANRRENTAAAIKSVTWARGGGWSEKQSSFSSIYSAADKSRTASALLQSSAFLAYCLSNYGDTATFAKIEPPGGVASKVIVTYDDAKIIRSKVAVVNGISQYYANATMPITVTWDIVRDDSEVYYCAAKSFDQQSATFYWREQGETNWNAIYPQTASDKSVTIPAGTFLSSVSGNYKKYEYYIEATDANGLTTQTGVITFETNTTWLYAMGTFAHYYPLVPPPEYDGDGNSPHYYYWNPHEPITFYWATVGQEPIASTVHAVLYSSGYTTITWKVGEFGEEYEIHVPTFGAIQYSVPADTFPSAEWIYYQIRGTDATGVESSPEIWIRFSTQAAVIDSAPIAPVNTVETANQPITFEWVFSSTSAARPVRYELVWREYGAAEWTVLHASTEYETSFEAPANTFPIGQIEWAVFAYNVDNIVGDYVSSSFIAYGAPEAPQVSATSVPFTTITWQAVGQQAFEVEINGTTYGPYFGEDKKFEPPDKLTDGEYVIRVRVAGTYFLWSEWGSTSITVENSSEFGVYLSGEPSVDAHLTWETDAETGDFYVYRDGVLIARTLDYFFDDRLANGIHVYQVLNRLPEGHYCISEEVPVGTAGSGTFITAANARNAWIHLKYSTVDNNNIQFTDSADSAFYNYSGSRYPHGFTSIYRDSQVIISVAFKDSSIEDLKSFEALLGEPVILKHKDDPVFVGIINSWTKQVQKWPWVSYSCNVQRIDWEDYFDGTP